MIRIISTLLLITTLYSQSECDGVRYTDEIFSQVNVTSNVLYGGNYNPNIWGQNEWEDLYLDIYEPAGDEIENRPLVFFLFLGMKKFRWLISKTHSRTELPERETF